MVRLMILFLSIITLFSCGGSKEDRQNAKLEESPSDVVESTQKLQIGSIAPDFSLPDPGGKLIHLSDFRGKYLFLDFWGSWCLPCRKENPELVKIYNQFKDHNFEILGIAFDKKKDKWIDAIESDGLEWPQVSDLKYFDSEMIGLYYIENVPATMLLDPEGKIIAINVHANELEKLLKKLL